MNFSNITFVITIDIMIWFLKKKKIHWDHSTPPYSLRGKHLHDWIILRMLHFDDCYNDVIIILVLWLCPMKQHDVQSHTSLRQTCRPGSSKPQKTWLVVVNHLAPPLVPTNMCQWIHPQDQGFNHNHCSHSMIFHYKPYLWKIAPFTYLILPII